MGRGPLADGVEIRKLQLTGGSSIAMTLPKPWVERAGLAAGDSVGCILRQDGSLLVTPRPGRERAPMALRLELGEEDPEHLFRRLVAAYLNGYGLIEVHSKRPIEASQRATVRHAVKRAIGMEVVDEGPHAITIQDFLDPTQFPLEKGLRRMASMAQLMHQDAMAALAAQSGPGDATMEERDHEVDRLYWLVNKQYHALLRDARLAERLDMTPGQALNFLLVARLVERTADHAKRIGDNVAELQGSRLDPGVLKRIHALDADCLGVFKDGIAAFFRRDARLANDAIDRARAVHGRKRRMVHEVMELKGATAVALAYVLESVERTASYGSDVAEVAINHVLAGAEED